MLQNPPSRPLRSNGSKASAGRWPTVPALPRRRPAQNDATTVRPFWNSGRATPLELLNPDLPPGAQHDAFCKPIRPECSSLQARHRPFHRSLADGVAIEHRTTDGTVRRTQVSVLDHESPANNDCLPVNRFTFVEGDHERRPDIVFFVNGLPLGLIAPKNPADKKATVWTAWNQIQTSRSELTDLFVFNTVPIASYGIAVREGAGPTSASPNSLPQPSERGLGSDATACHRAGDPISRCG